MLGEPEGLRPREGDAYACAFAVEVDTVAGVVEKTIEGRFVAGPCGYVYDHDA